MPHTIQAGEYSMAGGAEGILHVRSEPQWQPERAVSHRERRQGQAELELARQQLERQQSGAPLRNSFRYQTPLFIAGFGFAEALAHTNRRASGLPFRHFRIMRHTSSYRALVIPRQP